MHDALKAALSICKNLLRNGFDAHVINAPLQEQVLQDLSEYAVDIACEPDVATLSKLYHDIKPAQDSDPFIATLMEQGVLFRIYALNIKESSLPDLALLRTTPTIMSSLSEKNRKKLGLTSHISTNTDDPYAGFALQSKKFSDEDPIRLEGIPDLTLQYNYLLAIRALRFAANFDAQIEPNTWLAIVRSSGRVLDYVPARYIMEEWRKVAAESLHRFVKLMYDAHILHGIIPEVTALASIPQTSIYGEESRIENVFDHTLECMKQYTEHSFHHDWIGTMAMLFHDVGKLFTCEYLDGEYTFFQHHRVGAKVTRKILQRLHFAYEDIDLICHLVANHMRFHFMMTDRGIRRFKALAETPRLIAMAKADIEAREDKYTSFNHNMKYLGRADKPECMIEPLLNGNEIMRVTNLEPGPVVGNIREALLTAQKDGLVFDHASAVEFVKDYVRKLDS